MAKTIALGRIRESQARLELLRGLIVCGCALALIAAGRPLPFLF